MPDIKTGTIQITGLQELEKALLELPQALHGKVLNAAVREGAKEIRKEAQNRAPVGSVGHQVGKKGRKSYISNVRPGHLKRNIKIRIAKTSKGEAKGYVYVSWKAFYGRFLEYGTKRMSAKPFLRPAFDGQWQAAARKIGDELWDKTAAAAKNLAGGMGLRDKGILK